MIFVEDEGSIHINLNYRETDDRFLQGSVRIIVLSSNHKSNAAAVCSDGCFVQNNPKEIHHFEISVFSKSYPGKDFLAKKKHKKTHKKLHVTTLKWNKQINKQNNESEFKFGFDDADKLQKKIENILWFQCRCSEHEAENRPLAENKWSFHLNYKTKCRTTRSQYERIGQTCNVMYR